MLVYALSALNVSEPKGTPMAISRKADASANPSTTRAPQVSAAPSYPEEDAFAAAANNQAAETARRKREDAEKWLPRRFKLDMKDGTRIGSDGKVYTTRTSAEIVILDDCVLDSDGRPGKRYFGRNEYSIWFEHEKKTVIEPYLGEITGYDPVGQAMQEKKIPAARLQRVTFLTVRELLEETYIKTMDDGTTKEVTRKDPVRLLVLKPSEIIPFQKLHQKFGGLRGVHLKLARDPTNDKSPRNGTIDPIFDIVKHSEEDILEEWGHPELTGKKNDVLKAENADCYAIDYRTAMPLPTAEEQAAQYRVRLDPIKENPLKNVQNVGSKAFNQKHLKEDDLPEEGEAPAVAPRIGGIRKPAAGGAPAEQVVDADYREVGDPDNGDEVPPYN